MNEKGFLNDRKRIMKGLEGIRSSVGSDEIVSLFNRVRICALMT
jgi:hypothetical protein